MEISRLGLEWEVLLEAMPVKGKGKEGNQGDEEKMAFDAAAVKSSAHSMASSDARMAFQSCPELGQGSQAFVPNINPSLEAGCHGKGI